MNFQKTISSIQSRIQYLFIINYRGAAIAAVSDSLSLDLKTYIQGGANLSIKDSLIKKVENQIDAWEKEVESAKAQAREKESQAENEKAGAELREEAVDQVRDLQDKIDSARQKLDEIRRAGEDQIDDIKRRMGDWFQ